MILDKQLMFSDAQAVTAAAASTNVVDIGSAKDIGVGDALFLVVLCTVAMTDGSSDSTLAVTLRTDDALSGTALESATTLATIGTFAAVAAAGTRLIYRLPPGLAYQRYLDVYYTPANGNLTTGTFSAFLVSDVQLDSYYPSGFSVV